MPFAQSSVVLLFADRGDGEYRPLLRLGFEDASGEVVLMPSRHDEELPRIIVQTGRKDGVVPIPHPLSVSDGVCLVCILYRVVDDRNIDGCTCQRTSYADRLVKSSMSYHLEEIDIPQITPRIRADIRAVEIGFGEYRLILLAVYRSLNRARKLLREVGGVGASDDFQVGVLSECPCGEIAGDDFRLSVLRGHENHQVLDLALQQHLAMIRDELMEPLQLIFRIAITEETRKGGRSFEFQLLALQPHQLFACLDCR